MDPQISQKKPPKCDSPDVCHRQLTSVRVLDKYY